MLLALLADSAFDFICNLNCLYDNTYDKYDFRDKLRRLRNEKTN